MRSVTEYPRDQLDAQSVIELLQGSPTVEVGYGLEIFYVTSLVTPLDPESAIADISDVLTDGSSVAYDNTADIGGTAMLMLDPAVWADLGNGTLVQQYAAPGSLPTDPQAFYWGNPRTRVRPYMTLSAPNLPTAKFYLGVYIPATPVAPMNTTEPIYAVTCYDQTSIFDVPITTSISFPAGANVLTSVQSIIAMFQIAGESYLHLNVDESRSLATLTAAMNWAINSDTTYLQVINDLLASIGYDNVWSDCFGYIQVTSYLDPRTQPAEWVFDATDPENNVIDPDGSWQPDVWQIPNTWLFIQNNTLAAPVEGNGQYTVLNQSSGPTSIDKQLGRVVFSYHELDATSQNDLVTQGNALVVQESLPAETFTINTSPFPTAAHKDLVQFISDSIEANMLTGGNSRQCYVTSWTLPLNGDDMTWQWGTVA